MLDHALHSVAVIGAVGKMGSGIALLLLQEMARLEAAATGRVGSGKYSLTLIDSNAEGFSALRAYLRAQITRYAEKQINPLRASFKNNPSLVSNQEMIEAFVQGALDSVRFEGDLSQAKGARLVFEAVVEDMALKTAVLSQVKEAADEDARFFTNTSSIPIGALALASGLEGRLIGYHFYNPPAVQKLLEIIPAEGNADAFIALADDLAKRLGKIVIYSDDVAGFIGNGLFLREINEALSEVQQIQSDYSQVEAVCLVDQMTRELLIRPMGIFQLFDYVGIDVLRRVMEIMASYLDIPFHRALIDQMTAAGRIGGQYPDGSQKDGFFQYQGHRIEKVYSLEKQAYVPLPGDLLGTLPEGHLSWKEMGKRKDKDERLEAYFRHLFAMETPVCRLAAAHLMRTRAIARQLVADGVARSIEDVNQVMMHGFYHLYGPDCPYFPEHLFKPSDSQEVSK